MGIVIFKIWVPNRVTILTGYQKHLGLFLVYLFVLAIIVLIMTDTVCIYGKDVCGRSIINAAKGKWPETFFQSISFGPDWHRVKPYEGMIYMIILPWIYFPLSRKLDR